MIDYFYTVEYKDATREREGSDWDVTAYRHAVDAFDTCCNAMDDDGLQRVVVKWVRAQ